jgi:hypothetical protein
MFKTVRMVSSILFSTAKLPEGAVEYLALSHFWGGKAEVKLTKANLANTRLSLTTLPPNFQDAVSITHKLGMRYIWIDSICIVQDDEKEWELQSTYMGPIYANARCVISATASKDTEGGCYRPRDLYRSTLVLCEKGSTRLLQAVLGTPRQPRRGLFTTETTASHQFSLNPAETMSSPQPGPPPGNASLDLEALRKQLDEDYGKAYDLMGAGTLAFSSDIEGI